MRRLTSAETTPPNMSVMPTADVSAARCASAMMASIAAVARARSGSSSSRAPAAVRLSSERVLNRALAHLEIDARAVDRGRLDPDAEALRLAAEFAELVGVVEVERHRG